MFDVLLFVVVVKDGLLLSSIVVVCCCGLIGFVGCGVRFVVFFFELLCCRCLLMCVVVGCSRCVLLLVVFGVRCHVFVVA